METSDSAEEPSFRLELFDHFPPGQNKEVDDVKAYCAAQLKNVQEVKSPDGQLAVEIIQDLNTLLRLQVDCTHARKLFEALGKVEDFVIVTSVVHVMKQGIHAFLKSPGRNPPQDPTQNATKEYLLVHNFVKKNLFDPVPLEISGQSSSEATARKSASARDSGEDTARCPLTGVAKPQMAHLIKKSVAGAYPDKLWFWLLTALILPEPYWRQMWRLCGGDARNSLNNVFYLHPTLHGFFDELAITFRQRKEGASTFLEVELIECQATLAGLYTKEGKKIENNLQIPYETYSSAPTPDGALFEVHRMLCFAKRLITLENIRPKYVGVEYDTVLHPWRIDRKLGDRWSAELSSRLATSASPASS